SYSFLSLLSLFISTPFPYTTLFRSDHEILCALFVAAEKLGVQDGVFRGRAAAWARALDRLRLDHALGADRQELFGCRAQQTDVRSEEHTSELQSRENLVCRLLLEKK